MSETPTGAPSVVRSAFSCSLVIGPVVALLYLCFNSQAFRDYVCDFAAAAMALVIGVIEAGSDLSPLILYVLIGCVWWIECICSKLQGATNSVPTLKRLVSIQFTIYALSLIMAVPHIYGTSMPIFVTIVVAIHAFLGGAFIHDSVESLYKPMPTDEEGAEADEMGDDELSDLH